MLEVLEPKIEDNEILTGDEAEELRCAMQAKISEAVALGVFTDAEAEAWEEGFEACDQLEYMQNLIEIVDDFIASGLEVVEQIGGALDTDLLTEQEKTAWQTQAELMSFQDKCELLQELSGILSSVASCKRELMHWLHQVPDRQAKELWRSFEDVDSSQKDEVVRRAVQAVADNKIQYQKVQSRVHMLVSGQQFKEARSLLNRTVADLLTATEYKDLISEIDAAEIAQVRQIAQAA